MNFSRFGIVLITGLIILISTMIHMEAPAIEDIYYEPLIISMTLSPKEFNFTGSIISGKYNITFVESENVTIFFLYNESGSMGHFSQEKMDRLEPNYTMKIPVGGWTYGSIPNFTKMWININQSRKYIVKTCWHEKMHMILNGTMVEEHTKIYLMLEDEPNIYLNDTDCEFIWWL